MGKINFKKDRIPFTQVANEVLNDPELTSKAKGLYAYLYSKPEGWDFAIDRITKEFKDSRFSINSGLQELEREGYLIRERQKTGRVIYLLKSQMTKINIREVEPHDDNCKVQKLQSAKTVMVSNTDKEVIKSLNNKDSYGELKTVKLSLEETKKLNERLGTSETLELIEQLDLYVSSTGKKYKSHYATILSWSRRKKSDTKGVTFIDSSK